MHKQIILDAIQQTDIDLKILQSEPIGDSETPAEIDAARELLRKLKVVLLKNEPSVFLGNTWSFGSLRLILPVINMLEQHGVSVLYAPHQVSKPAHAEIDV